MKKYKIIVNPESGRGAGGRAIPQIDSTLKAHNLDFDIVTTEEPWHAAELTQQAVSDGFDVVDVGATVTIQEEDYPPEHYYVVGTQEADPTNGRISNE